MPVDSSAASCRLCGAPVTKSLETPGQQAKFKPKSESLFPRGRFDDLILLLLDLLLMTVTLIIGGLIWSVVIAFSGQSPAGQIRDKVIINLRTNQQAPALKIMIRQAFTALSIAYIAMLIFNGFTPFIDVGGYYFATYFIPSFFLGLIALDLLFTLTPFRRRLIDWALAIRWVNGDGYSWRNYKAPGGYV
jgi:hypothetical protein